MKSEDTNRKHEEEETPIWLEANQALRNIEAIQARLRKCHFNLMREDWLPMGLRSLVVEKLPTIQRLLERKNPNFDEIAAHAHSLALCIYSYGDRLLDLDFGGDVLLRVEGAARGESDEEEGHGRDHEEDGDGFEESSEDDF